VGGLVLATLQQGLRLNGVDPVYFSIVTGLCIVAGVVFDRVTQRLASNRPPPDRGTEGSSPGPGPQPVEALSGRG
jgi:hypothetical protein